MGLFDSPTHLLILLVVVLILFGSRKMPDAARSLGRSMRIFKAETQGLRDSGQQPDPGAQAVAPQPLPAPPLTVTQDTTAAAPAPEAQRTSQS